MTTAEKLWEAMKAAHCGRRGRDPEAMRQFSVLDRSTFLRYAEPFLDKATCKACRHWGRLEGPNGLYPKQECGRLQAYDDKRLELFELDADDWEAIKTGPDFGCILFEPLEAGQQAKQDEDRQE